MFFSSKKKKMDPQTLKICIIKRTFLKFTDNFQWDESVTATLWKLTRVLIVAKPTKFSQNSNKLAWVVLTVNNRFNWWMENNSFITYAKQINFNSRKFEKLSEAFAKAHKESFSWFLIIWSIDSFRRRRKPAFSFLDATGDQ